MNEQVMPHYRQFRTDIVKNSRAYRDWEQQSAWLPPEQRKSFKAGREIVAAFRETVRYDLQLLLETGRATEASVRKALQIPNTIPLSVSKWNSGTQWIYRLAPTKVAITRASALLRQIKTYEGRKHVYFMLVQGTLNFREDFFSPSSDMLLRHFNHSTDARHNEQAHCTDENIVKAFHHIGIRDTATVLKHKRALADDVQPVLLKILVEEKFIENVDQLSLFPSRERSYYHNKVQDSSLINFRKTVRTLKQHGVALKDIVPLTQLEYHPDPSKLVETIQLLINAGVTDIGEAFRQVGNVLWTGELPQWRFVLNDLLIRDVEDLGLFKITLMMDGTPPSALGSYLKSMGLTASELAAFEPIFSLIARDRAPSALDRFKLLAEAPYSLPPATLATCERYVDKYALADLEQFLACLHEHGYVTAQAVLDFQPCFAVMSLERFSQALGIYRARSSDDSPLDAANWVREFGRRYERSKSASLVLKYLAATISLPTPKSLYDILLACKLELPIVEYVVKSIGLTTARDILDWVRAHERHFKKFQGYESDDPALKLLMDDGRKRNNYAFVARNYVQVIHLAGAVAEKKAGPFPPSHDRAEVDEYWDRERAARVELQGAVLESAKLVLKSNDGILLSTLLSIAFDDPTRLPEAVRELTPLVDELMMGRGPSDKTLTVMGADAIELLYGVSPLDMSGTWNTVAGVEHHLQAWCPYPSTIMQWKNMKYETDQALDKRAVEHFRNASDFALRFDAEHFQDMFDACNKLSPKQLGKKEADTGTLHRHLGILMAVARGYSIVDEWLNGKVDNLVELEATGGNSHQLVTELSALFTPGILDGLTVGVDRFLARFPEKDISHLLLRFSGRAVAPAELSNIRKVAKEEILGAAGEVIQMYSNWVKRELRKFKEANAENASVTSLIASASKHPAAFFAKSVTKLCSDGNTDMWLEDRHAHIVVFDKARKKFVGMAMVYRESFSVLVNGAPSLILRAINPTAEALDEFDLRSIVDGFFSAAKDIAMANGLACVAITDATGQHFLSNHEVIQKDIEERYLRLARTRSSKTVQMVDLNSGSNYASRRHSMTGMKSNRFYAYEKGDGAVSTLFVIWSNPQAATPEIENINDDYDYDQDYDDNER